MFYTKLVANHDCRRSVRWSLTFGKIYMPIFMFNLLCKQEHYFRGIFKRNMIWYHMFIKPSRNSWLSTIIVIIKMMIIIITIKWWWIIIIIIIIRAVNVRALGLVKKRMDQNLGTWDCWSDKRQWAAKDHPLVLETAHILRRFLSILSLPLPAQNLRTLLKCWKIVLH